MSLSRTRASSSNGAVAVVTRMEFTRQERSRAVQAQSEGNGAAVCCVMAGQSGRSGRRTDGKLGK